MQSDVLSLASLAPAYPEIILAIGAVAVLLVAVFFKTDRSRLVAGAAIILLAAVLVVILFQPADGVIFNGGFISDSFSRYMKALVVGASGFTLLISLSTAKENGLAKFEYSVLVLLARLCSSRPT